MRRRDLLRFGAAVPAVFASRLVRGETKTITRAAVVIGIDRAKDLPTLHAAVSGAKKVGDWLESEGIEVKRFSDEAKPVRAEDIFDGIDEFIRLGTLQQLIIYFAGHGSFVGTGEYWLLSQALRNSNQAVSVNQCIQYSRQCGIPNVVLISDACRSTSASLSIQALTGYNIFPVVNNRKVFTLLDTFFAARPGAPAYEIKDATGKYEGIYTSCFLDAYIDPDSSMIEDIDGVKVVTNKKLETYLLSEVPRRALISDVQEFPDSSVTSSTYIGRPSKIHNWTRRPERLGANTCKGFNSCMGINGCRGVSVCKGLSSKGFNTQNGFNTYKGFSPISPRKPKISTPPLTISNLAELELSQAGILIGQPPKTFSRSALEKIDKDVGFSASREQILNARGPNVFKHGTGINVFGARLGAAVSTTMETLVLREGDGSSEPAVVQINPRGKRQDSIALEFEDGSGTVVAGLQGYVTTVVVDKSRVVSVSYEQATVGEQLAVIPSRDNSVKHLHALVATAARFGVFRIDGPPEIRKRNATQLSNAIRVGNSVDPTLAIYAACAYAEAALPDQIRSAHSILKNELEIDFFDVALLAGRVAAGHGAGAHAPFCPMLNSSWQFLALRNVTLSSKIAEAQTHILPSLWTTFDREGMSIIRSLLQLRTIQ